MTFSEVRYTESLPLDRDSSSRAFSFSAESLLLECRYPKPFRKTGSSSRLTLPAMTAEKSHLINTNKPMLITNLLFDSHDLVSYESAQLPPVVKNKNKQVFLDIQHRLKLAS